MEQNSEMKKYAPGDIIAEEGDNGTDLYVLIRGKIGVYKRQIKVAEIDQKGSIIGEIGVILGTQRTATIAALEETLVFNIPGNLEDLITEHPDVVKKILVNMADRLKKTTQGFYVLAND